MGEHQPIEIYHIFMSIQTFNSKEFKKYTLPNFYYYIIIGELYKRDCIKCNYEYEQQIY